MRTFTRRPTALLLAAALLLLGLTQVAGATTRSGSWSFSVLA